MTADQTRCTEAVLKITPEAGVIANLGTAAWTLAAVADRDRNFCLTGAMGLTTAVGLGAALHTDHQITVLEGDGSLLMSLGVLTTVGAQNPSNLTVVVWENNVYETTGGQRTTESQLDLAAIAAECGISSQEVAKDSEFLDAYAAAVESDEATLIVCDINTSRPDERPTLDYGHSHKKHAFRESFRTES